MDGSQSTDITSNLFLAPMSSIRALAAGLSLIAVARSMSAVTGSSEVPGFCLAGAGDSLSGSPPRLLRLADVPGHEPHRVNDMLLLSPAGAQSLCGSGTEAAEDGSQHVVFFPGDIQVRDAPPIRKASSIPLSTTLIPSEMQR